MQMLSQDRLMVEPVFSQIIPNLTKLDRAENLWGVQ